MEGQLPLYRRCEIPSENAMLDAMSPLRSTILKPATTGSTSTVDAFLETVSPEVWSLCGADNSYGHPHREVLEKLEDADIKVFDGYPWYHNCSTDGKVTGFPIKALGQLNLSP